MNPIPTHIARILLGALAALDVTTAAVAADAQIVDVKLGSYYIKPGRITVKTGQPVTLKLTNEAALVPHNLIVRAPAAGIDIKVDVAAGNSAAVTFTPTAPGSYEMYCDKRLLFFESHKDKGMRGMLIVE